MKRNILIVLFNFVLAAVVFFTEARVVGFWSGILLVLPCVLMVSAYLLANGKFPSRVSIAAAPWVISAIAAYVIILEMAPVTDQIGSLDKLFFEVTVMSVVGGIITIGVFKAISELFIKKRSIGHQTVSVL
ncbi:MAG: hypothetical protein HWE27_12360 [Gammaproteobacteria bacterium]|nr:hypothetical protein [Gammaproteobacteria bacterium]